MSGGLSYTGGATHDEFCDTTVGSGREHEEGGRANAMIELFTGTVEPDEVLACPVAASRVVS